MATHSSSGNSHTLVYKNYSQSDKRVPNPMVNYVGVHVLHNRRSVADSSSVPGNNEGTVQPAAKTRKNRKRPSSTESLWNESAPQEQVQLNGADSQGSVGGSAA